jgi:hypothetical protein
MAEPAQRTIKNVAIFPVCEKFFFLSTSQKCTTQKRNARQNLLVDDPTIIP